MELAYNGVGMKSLVTIHLFMLQFTWWIAFQHWANHCEVVTMMTTSSNADHSGSRSNKQLKIFLIEFVIAGPLNL